MSSIYIPKDQFRFGIEMLLVSILTCEYVLKDWEFLEKKNVVSISGVQWEVAVMAEPCNYC